MKAYPDRGHPEGRGNQPWFEIRKDKLYPDRGHPDGKGAKPWFELRSLTTCHPSIPSAVDPRSAQSGEILGGKLERMARMTP